MSVEHINAELMLKMFLSGASNLEANRDWIDELNVFPVPDGDTGTNMTLTIKSAVEEVGSLSKVSMENFSKAIKRGSLRGARGNSGVILSQLIRGFSKSIQDQESIDKKVLAGACRKAAETAYKAVMKPKEGTILTVARAVAEKAVALERHKCTLEEYLTQIVDEGDRILKKTPEMLPVLKEAGVVDSGGQGLMLVLHGALDAFLGKEVSLDILKGGAAPKKEQKPADAADSAEEIKFGYCTEFIIRTEKEVTKGQLSEFKAYLENKGDSIVLVADDGLIKVHVHTNDPGKVLQKGLGFGELIKIKIDNMREEHRSLIGDDGKTEISFNSAPAAAGEAAPQEPPKKYGFISVSVGDGFKELFENLGVDRIISGGQTMNPSTDDFMTAIREVNAMNIFVFPNNKNIVMAANQAAKLTKDKNIIVIPTKTVPQGITSMVCFASEMDPEENEGVMKEAIEMVSTASVTYSVRDTKIDDFVIEKDDKMAVGDEGILAVGKELKKVCEEAVERMYKEDESEVISVYYGEGCTEEEAQEIAASLEETYPDAAVELSCGGQPVYYCIISVE